MTANMKGFLFANKKYISKDLFLRLMARGLKIITGTKHTIKNISMSFDEKILMRNRSLAEITFDYLENKFMLEHLISTLTAHAPYILPIKYEVLRRWVMTKAK